MILDPMIIIEKQHPLYKEISSQWEVKSLDQALASFETHEIVIDLSLLRTKKKIILLKELARTTKAKIISDLTLCWGEQIFRSFPQVIGAVSMLFKSPTNAVEYAINQYSQNPASNSEELVNTFIRSLNKEGVLHRDLKLTFHYPRTIAMIVNEAYFALEESLATQEAIDLAMKNGVNYPLGPIEWAQNIGLHHITELLHEIYEITEDPRYKISKELKLHAQLGIL
jgi:3-hydroxybutyryl-CoA dehydrogenase